MTRSGASLSQELFVFVSMSFALPLSRPVYRPSVTRPAGPCLLGGSAVLEQKRVASVNSMLAIKAAGAAILAANWLRLRAELVAWGMSRSHMCGVVVVVGHTLKPEVCDPVLTSVVIPLLCICIDCCWP